MVLGAACRTLAYNGACLLSRSGPGTTGRCAPSERRGRGGDAAPEWVAQRVVARKWETMYFFRKKNSTFLPNRRNLAGAGSDSAR